MRVKINPQSNPAPQIPTAPSSGDIPFLELPPIPTPSTPDTGDTTAPPIASEPETAAKEDTEEAIEDAAAASPKNYVVVPPDDDGEGETSEAIDGVLVFSILVLIVLAVATVMVFIRMKKKTSRVKADGCPPVKQNTSKVEQPHHTSATVFFSEQERSKGRKRTERYAEKYGIPIEEFYPDNSIHRHKPKKEGMSEASGKPSSPPKMKPPLSY